MCHVLGACSSPCAGRAPLLLCVPAAPWSRSAGGWSQVHRARISALQGELSSAPIKTCSVKPSAACMPPASPRGPAALGWDEGKSPPPQCLPLLGSREGTSSPGCGGEMNPGSRASSEMQIALQVLSINYRAWASR